MSGGPRVTDPFQTAALRDGVLAAWRDSPTRFREDANAEEDLYLGGYRDRLFVELAQNAADAAAVSAADAAAAADGKGGHLRVSFVDGELRVANTGKPLDQAGVASLASLRASAKQDGVGRFGVGFAAVLSVTDAPRVVSTSGGVAFDAQKTREASGRDGRVPVLRLCWPTDERPPDGFDTEVRLPLKDGITPQTLKAEFERQVTDLLLALDALRTIEIDGDRWWRDGDDIHGPHGTTRWAIVRDRGELADLTGLGAEARPQWTVCWARQHETEARQDDVLHAPTPTDERLSLPARLIATLPLEPDRRHVRKGPAADTVLAHAARNYPRLLEKFPPENRVELVPEPGFPLSEVDEQLRRGITEALRSTEWLPTPTGTVEPRHAKTVPSAECAQALDDVIDGITTVAFDPRLQALDVTRLTVADIVAQVTGIDRPPTWWHRLYTALAPLADVDRDAREALGALPVPLTDGRTLPGPRGLLIADRGADRSADGSADGIPKAVANVVHPDAVHPLLERLGARRAGPGDLLDATRDAVARSLDDAESGLDTTDLRDTVLALTSEAGPRDWLGALAMPDDAGDPRRADELVLPGSPLLDLLDEDAPLGVLRDDVAEKWPRHVLAAVGVLDTFAVVKDEAPTGPDHDLDDEQTWWDERAEPPKTMTAVRDLDLVADDAWPAALRLLAREPDTWQALHEPHGYTGWWIAHNALLAGRAPRDWRLANATDLAGLYDPVPDIDADPATLEAIGVRQKLEPDGDLLERLADPDRDVPAGTTMRAHAALAKAFRDGELDDVDPPSAVRSLTGQVVPAAEGLVLDAPWVLQVVEPERIVSAGPDLSLAEPLAELLDLPLADEEAGGTVTGGEPVRWADLGAVVEACDLAGIPVPPGGPLMHDRLTVHTGQAEHDIAWWVDDRVLHCVDSTAGLARALAWAADRWADRYLLAALLDDPEGVLS
jgi:hypothetical protein